MGKKHGRVDVNGKHPAPFTDSEVIPFAEVDSACVVHQLMEFTFVEQPADQGVRARRVREISLEHAEGAGKLTFRNPGFGGRGVINPDDGGALTDKPP
jgi:hypothetical protein